MKNRFLLLNRLLVECAGVAAYDQVFHTGVNIIRGDNSSGKSTITDFIFFVLGGENIEWTDEALACDWVYAEVSLSGDNYALRREMSGKPNSISIFEGSLDDALKSAVGWSSYGRTRSSKRESFSQFVFKHLGFPEVKAMDSNSNVTMYQVLRLIYSDQSTNSNSIFRKERQPFADTQDLRRTIGEMLLGIDDLRGHELREELIHLNRKYAQRKSRLDSLIEAIERTDMNFRITEYSAVIDSIIEQQKSLEQDVEARVTMDQEGEMYTASLEVKALEKDLRKLNRALQENREEYERLSLVVEDSEVFVASLISDLDDLYAANSTLEAIGSVSFTYCPVCLSSLSHSHEDECPLCKERKAGGAVTQGRLRFEQELKHQISESKELLEKRRTKVASLKGEGRKLERMRNSKLNELRSRIQPSSQVDAEVSKLLKKIGYLSREIEELTKLESLKSEVAVLEDEVGSVKQRLDWLELEINRRFGEQEERRLYCEEKLEEITIDLLRKDIVDSDNVTLNDANGLVFSFEKDFLSVRKGRLSASTQVFLKNSFLLALLRFSLEDEDCRFPSFFILDNIEDKGMVPDRFRRFHNMLIEESEASDISHQVILTTSFIGEDLEGSKFCVGPSYDRPPYTLDIPKA